MVLRAYGPAREWIPAAVERLLLSDVPVCIWWLGELAPLGTYFDRVLRCADLLVVSSSDLSLGDLEKISEFARGRADLCALADLTWARLRTMRELVARFFDDAALMPQLERLSHIAIGYSPHPTADARDVASTEAALLMGWLAAALGFLPDSARWSRDPRGAELTILRSGQVAPIVIRLDREARDDVPRGSVLRVALTSGDAQVEVARQAQDACLLECECRAPGLVVPRQLVRAFFEEDPCLLSGYLVRPLRDRIFEASLHIASQIFRSIVHASRS